MTKKRLAYMAGVTILGAGSAFAETATAPIDITSVSTSIVPYIATAGGAGLLIFTGIKGIRIIIKAFNAAGK